MTPLSPAFESLKLATACLERKTVLYVPGVFGSGPSTPDVVEAMGHLERAIACVALAVEEGRSPEDPTAARVKVLEEENARLRRGVLEQLAAIVSAWIEDPHTTVTPHTAMKLLQLVSDKIGIGRWLTFRATTVDVTCPHCGALDSFVPGEDA